MVEMEKIVALCKNRGFVFPGSELYGGLANTWDYGPLGVELKNNIKREWWKFFVRECKNSVGMDGGILMNPQVWVASGHVGGFTDPLVDCKECKTRARADTLVDNKCPNCGKSNWTKERVFNLMFKTERGVTEESLNTIYLRPETAQSQFVNFLNLQRTTRFKLPFGVGQVGKAFRNEITPGNFIFRTVEFDQMEYQLFCEEKDSMKHYEEYKQKAMKFYTGRLGIKPENLKFVNHDTLAHYAKAAVDAEYNFPFGWGEVGGTHHRGTFDLGNHKLKYTPEGAEAFTPTVIESSHGLDRLLLAVLVDAYEEESVTDGDVRVVLRLKPSIAPYSVAVLPLQKKNLTEKSHEVFDKLASCFSVTYDETGSIGKRYRRQDEIGTPLCVTIDYETLEDDTVTIRDRDTMKQERVKIADLQSKITQSLYGCNCNPCR